MATRDKFVERFGEQEAVCMENAANGHKNGVHDKPGSDPFRWAIAICIGHECFSRPSFHESHGFTASFDDIKAWIREHGDLANHDGDSDYLALFCGAYQPFIPAYDEVQTTEKV